MKTIKQINDEINSLVKIVVGLNKKDDRKIIKRHERRISYLRHILAYLETRPKEKYLLEEKERLEKRLKSLEEKYMDWALHNAPTDIDPKKRRPYYNKEMGINKMKTQLRTINEIIL